MGRLTIPLRWHRPYKYMWTAGSIGVSIEIHLNNAKNYTGNFRVYNYDLGGSIYTSLNGNSLAEIKQQAQDLYDASMLPIVKKVKEKPRKTKPRNPPMCY